MKRHSLFSTTFQKASITAILPVVTLLAAVFLAQAGFAEVSLKNGNFFTGSKDVVLPGGFEPKIERVYNSKTSFKGLFGFGWGMEYEVYLETEGDGSVLVHEYGGGAENLFVRPAMNQADLTAAVDQIVAAAKTQGDVTGDGNIAEYRNRLFTDASFRQQQWSGYVKKSLLKPATLTPGTKLLSERFSYQVVTVLRDGYRRDFDNGRVELFRQDGKLRQIVDKNNNYITFSYDVPDQIAIRDNFGRTMLLNINDKGLITHIEVNNGKSMRYRYNDLNELVYAVDADGNTYQYEYDSGRRHNLTKITYPDKTTFEISYYPRDQFENVRTIKDRDDSLTEYSYNIDKNDNRHYTVSVKVLGEPQGDTKQRKALSSSSYEYINKAKPDGEEYTAEMVTTIDGDRTDTTYNQDGLPLKIQRGEDVTTFAYDSKGHVVLKTTSTEKTELAYDPVVNKVTWVQITDLASQKVTAESKFTYDSKGNLLTASSGETSVTLKYDANGRIAELDPTKGGDIAFTYDNNSKPIRITVLAHKGDDGQPVAEQSIDVTYNESGEIQKVDSTGGRAAALAITSAFQGLLDLIRPAGVTLSF